MSSLLSAYLDIWPDSHCKEGQSGDFKDGKKATERTRRRNNIDIAETTTGGNQLFERENKEQKKSEKNHEERDGSCRAPQDGKIQCGRWGSIFPSSVVFGSISLRRCSHQLSEPENLVDRPSPHSFSHMRWLWPTHPL